MAAKLAVGAQINLGSEFGGNGSDTQIWTFKVKRDSASIAASGRIDAACDFAITRRRCAIRKTLMVFRYSKRNDLATLGGLRYGIQLGTPINSQTRMVWGAGCYVDQLRQCDTHAGPMLNERAPATAVFEDVIQKFIADRISWRQGVDTCDDVQDMRTGRQFDQNACARLSKSYQPHLGPPAIADHK
jgi:hypothetical protein